MSPLFWHQLSTNFPYPPLHPPPHFLSLLRLAPMVARALSSLPPLAPFDPPLTGGSKGAIHLTSRYLFYKVALESCCHHNFTTFHCQLCIKNISKNLPPTTTATVAKLKIFGINYFTDTYFQIKIYLWM